MFPPPPAPSEQRKRFGCFAERSSLNLELRLLAMLVAEKESGLIAQCASNYFAVKLREATDGSSMKQAATKVKSTIPLYHPYHIYQLYYHCRQLFTLLEEKQKHSVLLELLEHIPWSNRPSQPSCHLEDWPPLVHIRWTCAKFAIRCHLHNDRIDSVFDLLLQLSQWSSQSDDEGISTPAQDRGPGFEPHRLPFFFLIYFFDFIELFKEKVGWHKKKLC